MVFEKFMVSQAKRTVFLTVTDLYFIIKCSSNCARCDWSVRVHYSSIKHSAYVTRVHYNSTMHLGMFFISILILSTPGPFTVGGKDKRRKEKAT